jgi:hypothetical protein
VPVVPVRITSTRDLELVDGQWIGQSPMGRVGVAFADPNPYGIVDHDVTLASGETVRNPVRVIPNADGCDVVFTVHRRAGVTADAFAADSVTADRSTLKRLMEV